MRFENGEMVVRVGDLRVGFVTRVEETGEEPCYRVMFQGGESAPLKGEHLTSARGA